MRSRGTRSQKTCSWLAGTDPAVCSATRGVGMERPGRKWRTSGLRRGPSTRSRLTRRGLALSCLVVGAGAARSPTHGSGTARLGHRSQTPGRAPVVATRLRTTLDGRGSCFSAGRTRADCSATPGNGMARGGRRSQTPVRPLAPVMPCVSRAGRPVRCCSGAQTDPTRGPGTGPSGRGSTMSAPSPVRPRRSCPRGRSPSSSAGSIPARASSFLGRGSWRGPIGRSVKTSALPDRQGHAMSYDETRQQVVLFGGSAAPSATATAADLFSDTWELPSPAAPPGTPTTRPILVGFTVIPGIVQQGTPFRLEVFLDQPAPVTTSVMVTAASGNFAEEVAWQQAPHRVRAV